MKSKDYYAFIYNSLFKLVFKIKLQYIEGNIHLHVQYAYAKYT